MDVNKHGQICELENVQIHVDNTFMCVSTLYIEQVHRCVYARIH